MSANATQIGRLSDLHARMKAHRLAIDEGKAKYAGEPEVDEYALRWESFVTEANTIGENATALWSSVSDAEISTLEDKFKGLVHEWNDRIPVEIALRRQVVLNKKLQSMADEETRSKKKASGDVVAPDLSPDVPTSTATTPDSPDTSSAKERLRRKEKDAPELPILEAKIGILGALALGTFAGSFSAKEDVTRALIAAGGSIVTVATGLVMFWPESKSKS